MSEARYEIVVTAPAARVTQETLPESVAFAVIDIITGSLLENPRRPGAPLRGNREVIVLRVGHKGDVYRSR